MHEPQLSVPKPAREKLIETLNQRLADGLDLWLQCKQAHWNVRGENFIALHKLFDEAAEQVAEFDDELAERAVALGGQADGTLDSIKSRSALPPYPKTSTAAAEHIHALSLAFAAFGASTRAAIDQAATLGDQATADVFTEITRGIDKLLWMIDAHRPR